MAACFNTDNADECRRLVEEAAKTAQGECVRPCIYPL
jgi:hypothetical protein